MADFFQTWLRRALASPGVLACGVRDQSDAFSVLTTQDGIPESRVQEIMRRLGETVRALQQNHIECDRLCWSLASGHVHCVLRPDGTMALLVAGFDPGAEADIELLLRDFQTGAQ
jgi:hypothetical protein